jgi:hypothetical protein
VAQVAAREDAVELRSTEQAGGGCPYIFIFFIFFVFIAILSHIANLFMLHKNRRQRLPPATKRRNHYSARSLGDFACYWRVTLALVTLALITHALNTLALNSLSLIRADFTDKRKIWWGACPLQTLSLSPPVEKGEGCAKDDYHHGQHNPQP